MYDLLIKGARTIDPETGLDAHRDVAVGDGRVAALASEITGPARREIDARGLVLLPGLVDSHVHLVHEGSPRSPAHQRLARAGVTTAVEFSDMLGVLDQWHESACGLTVLGLQALPAYHSTERIGENVSAAVRAGCVGVKIFGGHYPSTPHASARVIQEADEQGVYVAFHAGTTEHGSDLDGMRQAIELAEGRPLHLAHTSAYLRGAVDDPVAENRIALELLRDNPAVVSEAHLGPLNMCWGRVRDGELTDHIARNCLRLRGYSGDPEGLRRAFLDGYAHCHIDDSLRQITGADGLRAWADDAEHALLSFPVNLRLTAYLQTCARVAGGALAFEGPGEFVVDAISSDGGLWRNVILQQGLAMVRLGGLSMLEFAHKASHRPARMFGLHGKGRIGVDADADLVLVDPNRHRAVTTIAAGQVIFDGDTVTGRGGTVLTTRRGSAALTDRGIPHQVLDLETSGFRTGAREVPRHSRDLDRGPE